MLYLSLISGRNADLLIGQHVISAPVIKQSGLEIMSTGYMVIDGGAPTTVSYISNAAPLPADKNEIAMCTAMAGEMLGMKLIYMDSGSGAKRPVSESMIEKVAECISVPLIVGGGITDPEKAYLNCKAGADVIVVGNAIEKDERLIMEMAAAVHSVPVKADNFFIYVYNNLESFKTFQKFKAADLRQCTLKSWFVTGGAVGIVITLNSK